MITWKESLFFEMKIIDQISSQEGKKKAGVLEQTIEKYDLPFRKKPPSPKEIVTAILGRVLDHRFTLLRDFKLEVLDAPIPFILIGSSGIWVINMSVMRGIYRARGSTWEEMDERSRKFKTGKPNLQEQTEKMAKIVTKHLGDHEFQVPDIEPTLYFSDPGVHVDMTQPVVRIVLADALEKFAVGALQGEVVLERSVVREIVNSFQPADQDAEISGQGEEIRDAYSFQDLPEKKPPRKPSPLMKVGRGEPDFAKDVTKKVPFNRRQWFLIGLLVITNLIVLSVLVFVLLISP